MLQSRMIRFAMGKLGFIMKSGPFCLLCLILLLVVVPFAPVQSASQGGTTIRVSVASDGAQGNGESLWSAVSSDGRYTAFTSVATNLVSGDTNNARDTFVYDRDTGTTSRVSIATGGTQGNNNIFSYPDISDDGRYIVFCSYASNLVTGDTNGARDVFVHDRNTSTTTRISVSTVGTQGNNESFLPSISGDGRYVAFSSSSSNLVSGDTNGFDDVFVHDRNTGVTTRVSLATGGTQANDLSQTPSISDDGRYVVFNSWASNLDVSDTNGWPDNFLHDRNTGITTLVSVASDGTPGNMGAFARPFISGNGNFIAFYSDSANLVSDDTNGSYDVFVRDHLNSITTRVSVASDGTQANGLSWHPAISGSGQYVTFESDATNLVTPDTNGWGDIYVYDRNTGTITRVSESSYGVQGNSYSRFPFISANGLYVVYESNSPNLIDGDTNGTIDIFLHDRLASPPPTPTVTPILPTPTNTPVSSATPTVTATSVSPTNTPTITATSVSPTNTPTATGVPPTNTRTGTPVVPTATSTFTATPVAPTGTATLVPPSSTPTPTTTVTLTPTSTTYLLYLPLVQREVSNGDE